MFFHSRRLNVWLVSFLTVLVVYFIYNRLSRTPSITTSDLGQSAESIMDACDSNGKVGMVGDVGVGLVTNVRYTTLNAQKQIEREFGFEKLLHQDGNNWEIEKPYLMVYRRSFKCEIKGERARVEVETAGGRVIPKEGLLTGNVTIRIWPQRKGGADESVMYLDDIVFVGDKSQFSSAGAVEFVSNNVRLTGTGMELVYNGEAERLEFLKITKLRSLHVKRLPQDSAVSGGTAVENEPAASTGPVGQDKMAGRPGQNYRCVFDGNVVIESPRERLMADVVALNDIFVRSRAEDQAGVEETASGDEKIAESNSIVGGRRSTVSSAGDTAGDVTVSCDGSIFIAPMDSVTGQQWLKGRHISAAVDVEQTTAAPMSGKTTLRGGRIDYSVATGEAVAMGPSQVTFSAGRLTADVNDRRKAAGTGPAAVVITAQKQAKFEPASNKVIFEGDCNCTVSQIQGDATRQYIVLGDKLEIGLRREGGDKGATTMGSGLDVERLVATGREVHLASTKKAGSTSSPQAFQHLLEGVEMKCVRMDYNTVDGNFVATGPGLIKLDNSQTDEPQGKLSRISLRRKCYAFLRNFDSLEFFNASNRLVADRKGGSLSVDYLPILDGGKEDKVAVTASHVEADILETALGRRELKDFVAKGAVTYEDKDNQFAGSEVIYDTNEGILNFRGTKSRPCLFNGAIVDTVRYDLKTGRAQTRIKGPGAMR
jgi:lipopolysaccharide export system protein LptA